MLHNCHSCGYVGCYENASCKLLNRCGQAIECGSKTFVWTLLTQNYGDIPESWMLLSVKIYERVPQYHVLTLLRLAFRLAFSLEH